MRKITSFTCDEALWLRFKKRALGHGIKLGEYLERVLTEHLKEEKFPEEAPGHGAEKNSKKPAGKQASRFRGNG